MALARPAPERTRSSEVEMERYYCLLQAAARAGSLAAAWLYRNPKIQPRRQSKEKMTQQNILGFPKPTSSDMNRFSSVLVAMDSYSFKETTIPICAKDIHDDLRKEFAFLSGGRGKDNGWIITFPENSHFNEASEEVLRKVLTYLTSLPSQHESDTKFILILDRRLDTWTSVKMTLQRIASEQLMGETRSSTSLTPRDCQEHEGVDGDIMKVQCSVSPLSVLNRTWKSDQQRVSLPQV